MTRPYAEVIGDPIGHSKSPLIHNFWLGKLRIDAEYRACHVTSSGLRDYVDARNGDDLWRGCNVTLPHKRAIMPLLNKVDPRAEDVGAVNTVVMRDYLLEGFNSDRPGFLEPLKPFLANSKTFRRAYLIGSGGAALAIACGLFIDAKFSLVLYNRDPATAWRRFENLVGDERDNRSLEDLTGQQFVEDESSGANDGLDVIVNATSLGMTGQPPLEINLDLFSRHAIVYDIVYSPLETPLLKAARERGMRTVDGLDMLVRQAALSFEKFFRQPAPRQHDAELRERLIA